MSALTIQDARRFCALVADDDELLNQLRTALSLHEVLGQADYDNEDGDDYTFE